VHIIWISTKQWITLAEGIHALRTKMHTNIHTSVFVIIWLSVNLRVCCSCEMPDVIRRSVAHLITKTRLGESQMRQ
jgi:hypothetical protein